MPPIISAILCGVIFSSAMLWLAAPIGPANMLVALIGGAIAGFMWHEEGATKRAAAAREAWARGRSARIAR